MLFVDYCVECLEKIVFNFKGVYIEMLIVDNLFFVIEFIKEYDIDLLISDFMFVDGMGFELFIKFKVL